MSDLVIRLFGPFGPTPLGFRLPWGPGLNWTHTLAGVAIGAACFSVPLALVTFAHRRGRVVLRPMFRRFVETVVKAAAASAFVGKAGEAPRALRESEARHHANFVRALVPLHILDCGGSIVDVSDRWLTLLGYPREEVIGRAIGDFQEDGGAATRAILGAVFANEAELQDTPRRLLRRDGAVLDVLVSSHVERAPDGTPTHLISALVDVTAGKQAEEALVQSERSFRLIVEGVSDHAIYMLDHAGFVTNWNSGAERIKGYTAAEIVGEHFSRFYTEEDRAEGLPEQALATATTVGHYENEGWRVRKDGSHFWASVVIDGIREDGKIIGFAEVTRDISERQEAQRALEVTRKQLAQAQKMEAIGQLTGGIAHDFNNVLQAVTGNLELIRRRVRDDRPDVARLAGNALDAAEKATGLTSQLLAFARRQRLDPRPLDPAVVAEGMRGLLARTVGERIALRIETDSENAACFADRNQLESALLNLAINARDAIDGEMGTITVSVRHERVAAAPNGWPSNGEYVRIAVRDDGPGMPEEVRKRAFEPFFTTKALDKGSGLGLAQIHGFAHQSGGTVLIESAPGRGTEVAILLPRSAEPAERSAEPPASALVEPDTGFGETVLVVEDDAMVRVAMAETLRDLRYHVVDAVDADTALAMLDGGLCADVVLSDVSMPGTMDGVEFAAHASAHFPTLPFILTTGRLDALAGRALPPGVVFLRKPLNQAGIAAAVRHALVGAREPVGS